MRNTRRLQAAMRSSRQPAVKQLQDFDFTFQPSLRREQIESLHELGFVERRENVIFLGPSGVGKRHVYIRPRTPHLNGKVERSHRVDDQEFYQLDQDGVTDDIHLFNEKLREWEDYYKYHRPHGALNGQTPYERLVAKTSAGVLRKV